MQKLLLLLLLLLLLRGLQHEPKVIGQRFTLILTAPMDGMPYFVFCEGFTISMHYPMSQEQKRLSDTQLNLKMESYKLYRPGDSFHANFLQIFPEHFARKIEV